MSLAAERHLIWETVTASPTSQTVALYVCTLAQLHPAVFNWCCLCWLYSYQFFWHTLTLSILLHSSPERGFSDFSLSVGSLSPPFRNHIAATHLPTADNFWTPWPSVTQDRNVCLKGKKPTNIFWSLVGGEGARLEWEPYTKGQTGQTQLVCPALAIGSEATCLCPGWWGWETACGIDVFSHGGRHGNINVVQGPLGNTKRLLQCRERGVEFWPLYIWVKIYFFFSCYMVVLC